MAKLDYDKIIIETYNQLFKASIPEANFDELCETCTTYEDQDFKIFTVDKPYTRDELYQKGLKKVINFYSYYIPDSKFKEIVDNQIKKYKLKNIIKNNFSMTIYLGCGPTSSKKRWLDEHPDYTEKQLNDLIKEKYPDIKIEDLEEAEKKYM